MTFKEFYNKYCNGITFIVAIFSSILITLFIASTILSIGRIFIFPEKQQYISNNISMWSEWYKICPNEKCELIDLREPFLFDYSINSKYKYEKTYDEIVEEYKKVLEKENWQFLQKMIIGLFMLKMVYCFPYLNCRMVLYKLKCG